MTTYHPSFDPIAKMWFFDDGPEAPTLAKLLHLLPKGAKIQGYYPKGYYSQPMLTPGPQALEYGAPPCETLLIVASPVPLLERVRVRPPQKVRPPSYRKCYGPPAGPLPVGVSKQDIYDMHKSGQHLSYLEIAEQLHISRNQVGGIIKRHKNRLRRAMVKGLV